MVGNDTGYWDNPYWEYHLPVNPPLDPDKPVEFVLPFILYESVSIMNWRGESGLVFRPRLRDNVEAVNRKTLGVINNRLGLTMTKNDQVHVHIESAGEDEAPEVDKQIVTGVPLEGGEPVTILAEEENDPV